jgi:purine nucleosidase
MVLAHINFSPMKFLRATALITLGSLLSSTALAAPAKPSAYARQLVLLDTDIGDDIDDAFALSLILESPQLQLLGITTAFRDTALRAQLTTRFLDTVGRGDIPVTAGVATPTREGFSQAKYAEGGDAKKTQPGTEQDFILSQIRQHPGEITLFAIGPLTNIGATIDKDPVTFRKLKRVVLMGGSIYRGYNGHKPDAEWNIKEDPAAAQKLFASGVPLYVMPLDSTMLKLDDARRKAFFANPSTLVAQLHELYSEWSKGNNMTVPTLFDAMTVAYALNPSLCPTKPMHITVDGQGFTKPGSGKPNAQVCLKSDTGQFLDFVLPRLEKPLPKP